MLGLYTWMRRAVPGGTYFTMLMVVLSFWTLLSAVEIADSDAFVRIMCARLEYVAVTWAGPLWLLFVLDYGYRSRWHLTRKMHWLWAMPVVITALALTSDWHGLIWYRGAGDLLVLGHGIGLWANLIYTYLLVFAGLVLLILAAVRSYRKNYPGATALLIGVLIPIVTSMLYMIGFSYGGVKDITPLALAATVLLYTWGVFGQHLFDLVPVARDALVRSMADGELVLDSEGRIADLNPAAMRMFGITEAAVGQPSEAVLSKWPAIVESLRSENGGSSELMIRGPEGPHGSTSA